MQIGTGILAHALQWQVFCKTLQDWCSTKLLHMQSSNSVPQCNSCTRQHVRAVFALCADTCCIGSSTERPSPSEGHTELHFVDGSYGVLYRWAQCMFKCLLMTCVYFCACLLNHAPLLLLLSFLLLHTMFKSSCGMCLAWQEQVQTSSDLLA